MTTEKYDDFVKMLNQSGLDKLGMVNFAITKYLTTGNPSGLENIMRNHSHLVREAQRIVSEKSYHQMNNSFAPHPSPEEVHEKLAGDVEVGKVNRFGDMFKIPLNLLLRIMIVIGMIGSGKSVFIKRFLDRIIGQVNRNFNVIVVDPVKREYRGFVKRFSGIIIITRSLLKINMFEVAAERTIEEHTYDLVEVLISQMYLGGISHNILVSHILQLYKEHGCFDGSKDWPTLPELYRSLVAKRQSMKTFKMTEIYLNIENRLEAILESRVFNCKSGIPISIFQSKDLIIECDFLPANVRNFLAAFIVRSLFKINIAKGLADSTLRHLIVIDEARQLIEATRNVQEYGESAFNIDTTRVRAAGVGLILLTQDPNSISQTIRASAFSKLSFFQTDGGCLDWIQSSFDLDEAQRQFISRMPPCGVAVCKYGNFDRPFLIQVPDFALPTIDDINDLASYQQEAWNQIASYIVPIEIEPKAEKQVQAETIPPAAMALLYYMSQNPFLSVKELSTSTLFKNQTDIKEPKEWLIEYGYTKLEAFQLSGTKKTLFLVPTEKAYNVVQFKQMPGHGGWEHSLYQEKITEFLIAREYSANKEGRLSNGKPVDVLTWIPDRGMVGIEIQTHLDNTTDNIVADFKGKCDEVEIIIRDRDDKMKVMKMVSEEPLLEPYVDKIRFKTLAAFFGEG